MDVPLLPAPEAVLPHRPPFLFLDRCLECSETEAVAERIFDASEPFFAGHFPGNPIVPGVILVEAMAQTLAYLALRQRPGTVLLTGVDKCRVQRPVRPGERVTFKVQIERTRLQVVRASAQAMVGAEVAARARLSGWLSPSAGSESDSSST